MEINFYFSAAAKKSLTWDDRDTLEALNEGEVTSRGLHNLAARFMVDKDNNYLPHAQAKRILGKLTDDEIQVVLGKFAEAIKESAVPNASGRPSPLPTTPASPASVSPIGLELSAPPVNGDALPGKSTDEQIPPGVESSGA
jgi:hypothetical protein